jgi:tetratricopeptide (TPR) repeat protein
VTPLFRLDDRAKPSPSLARHAIPPVTVVLAWSLYATRHASPFVAMCIVAVGLLVFTGAEVLAGTSRDTYDRAALALQARGRSKELAARLERAFAFRLFGAPGEKASRWGAALAASGQREEAARAWGRALAGYPNAVVPRAIALGFAHAAYEAGWNRDAARAYRALMESDAGLPRVRARLAHTLARLGEDLEEADTLLTTAEASEDAVETKVARAAWLAASKRSAEARAIAQAIPREDVPAFLADEVATLRGPKAKAAAKKKSRA